ncbi:hypothetical protein K493DRAFT_215158, partial [Basidiobolus meristosporus CBS 931.73]
ILMPLTIPISHYLDLAKTVRTQTGRPSGQGPKFNYKLFNCNNFNIHYWSWNYRGCWHQTCPPIVPC